MLTQSLLNISKLNANKVAVKTVNESLTYKQLFEKSCNIAQNLKNFVDKLNLHNNTLSCGLVFNHGVSGIIGVVSCVLSGLRYVPLDTSYPENRLIYMINHSNIKFLITDAEGLSLTKELVNKMENPPQIIILEEIAYKSCVEYKLPLELDNNPDVYLLYTSGSTGKPKAVIQNAESIVHFANEYINNLNITQEDNLTLFSTYGHDAAVLDIFSGLLSGACLYPLDLRQPKNIFTLHDWLKENKITVWHSVPSSFRMFCKFLKQMIYLPHLRVIVLGGEAVRKSDFKLCNEKVNNTKLYNLYGQTESSYSAGNFILEGIDASCIGTPVKNTYLIIAINQGKFMKVPDYNIENTYSCHELSKYGISEGELFVCSKFIAQGYWKDEKATKNAFINSPVFGRVYRTGDFVNVDKNGKINFLGRKDHQVKIRGNRVEIEEIESTILHINNITECAVISKMVERQVKLIAFIKSNIKYSVTEINCYLEKFLPSYMLIFEVIMVNQFPLTLTGKIDRGKLESIDNL